MLNSLLHEIHRLRKLIRDAQAEIDRAPKLLKAHQTKLANLPIFWKLSRASNKKTVNTMIEAQMLCSFD